MKATRIVTLALAIAFAGLFYKQRIGVNWLIFEVLLLTYTFIHHKVHFKNSYIILASVCTVLTGVLYSIYGSINSLLINWFSLAILNGFLAFESYKSVVYSFVNGILNFFTGWLRFFRKMKGVQMQSTNMKAVSKYLKVIFLPVVIILLFIVLYSTASPFFYAYSKEVTAFIDQAFNKFWESLNLEFLFLVWIGLILVSWFIHKRKSDALSATESGFTNSLLRRRSKNQPSQIVGLKNEYRSGIFLLVSLNVLILFLNILEVKNVWFGFEWEGETLREFVHKGTTFLIIALLLSMAIVLYYFRANINFYTKNKCLKILTYIWMGQNALMVFSVLIRNIIYVNHFALAYKRIGLLMFLIASLIGIITIILKVNKTKSTFYLVRTNSLSVYLILVIFCFINWDIVIAKYNFKHAQKSYVHLSYLSRLSNKAIPYIDKNMEELGDIEVQQEQKFGVRGSSSLKDVDIDNTTYKERIDCKKELFYDQMKNKSWLSWTYADWKAFQYVQENMPSSMVEKPQNKPSN